MRVVVVGGKLQGVEATYLAHQAGWEVILVDRNPEVPAAGLCDGFAWLDVLGEGIKLKNLIKSADLVIPACEHMATLEQLARVTAEAGVPFVYDLASYKLTSSKQQSDRLFAAYGIPAPHYWPNCSLPVIAKPSTSSGSRGVRRLNTPEELAKFQERVGSTGDWVIQEFLEGDSYSLEVCGCGGRSLTLQVTEIIVDQYYDCRRVLAPAGLKPELEREFHQLGARLAELLNLKGIMDIEVIEHNGVLKVLEIDARLPSQTPTVVWKSTGVNMLELLYQVYVKGELPPEPGRVSPRGVVYEHLFVNGDEMSCWGEHIMADAGPLRWQQDFMGADEALTNYAHGRKTWVATLIITGDSRSQALAKHSRVMENIRRLIKQQGRT